MAHFRNSAWTYIFSINVIWEYQYSTKHVLENTQLDLFTYVYKSGFTYIDNHQHFINMLCDSLEFNMNKKERC